MARVDSPVERFRKCLAPKVHGFLDPHPRVYWRPKMTRLYTRGTSESGGRSWEPFGWWCPHCGRLELAEEAQGPLHFGPIGNT